MIGKNKRWLITMVIVIAVIITSTVIICSKHVGLFNSSSSQFVASVSDGSGGIIVTWKKDNSIYVQRINSSGQPQWSPGGLYVAECPPGSGLSLISDSLGGAILIWSDSSGRLEDPNDPAFFEPIPFYCQRINIDGEILWSNSPISTGKSQLIIPDGTGGIILAWNDYRVYYKGLQDDYLRLQKIAPDGRCLWGDEGILVVASSPFRPVTEEDIAAGIKGNSTRSRPTYMGIHDIVTDGNGGVFVFWEEENATLEYSIYAQRLNNNGNYVWSEKVTIAEERLHFTVSDNEGGAIVKTPEGTTYSGIGKIGIPLDVHINSDGELIGTKLYNPAIITMSDRTGGSFSIRIEEDPPYGPPQERHYIPWIQRLDALGKPLWEEKRALPDDERSYDNFKYLADGIGGVIISWCLQEESVAYSDIRARKLDANGEVRWSEEGILVFNIPEARYQKVVEIYSDGYSGAIIVATLGKSALRGDMVYVQRMDENGNRMWGDGIRIDR